ncbi:MAG: hypothetical protein OXN17_00185 [Candidatus Poribacteria bacterium]|nr:hypothetical protein [Candidatus Poribacteria bacterium]
MTRMSQSRTGTFPAIGFAVSLLLVEIVERASRLTVRELVLGHQPAGEYQNRSRAVYWDGRNQHGEAVATGMYFFAR